MKEWPALRQLAALDASEAYLTWVAGLEGSGCVRAFSLSDARLVIDFEQ